MPTSPQPELADACRALLRSTGLDPGYWRDDGPDPVAAAWLAAGDSAAARPAELAPDQWTMLRVCQALWTSKGGPALGELLRLPPAPLFRLTTYLSLFSVADGFDGHWASVW